ncbi:MAG: signal peptidase II, partial [Wujia sp.]
MSKKIEIKEERKTDDKIIKIDEEAVDKEIADSTKNTTVKRFKIYFFPIIIIALLTALDQLFKFIISSNFKLYESKPIIKDILEITFIKNEGVAWGLFQGKRVIFLVITAIVLLGCFFIYSNISNKKKYIPLKICIIVLIAGALGNMLDRIRLGYVIDFIYFKLINFPVFNFADILVVLS